IQVEWWHRLAHPCGAGKGDRGHFLAWATLRVHHCQPPLPKIAVITPYCREPLDVLAQCHESVLAQGAEVDHFMVADGYPREEVNAWNARHVVLPLAHADGGSTPRAVGSILADAEGYDFIAYLDADNWYAPGHIASLLELHRSSGALVCSCFRTFH